MGGMSTIVDMMNSNNETEFRNLVRRMARAHAKSGVNKTHIMAMLPEFLAVLNSNGIETTEEVEDAWNTFFDVLGNLLSKLKS